MISPPLGLPFLRGHRILCSLCICPKSLAFLCPRSPSPPSVREVLLLLDTPRVLNIPSRALPSTSPPAMSADLYPQSAYPSRSSYPARSDQQYSLSNPSAIVYPPQLLPSQQSIPEGQSTDASSHPSPRDSQSPKEEDPSVPKPDGAPQQQPAKPQATFLTKLYAYVHPTRPSRAMIKLTARPASWNGQRTTT